MFFFTSWESLLRIFTIGLLSYVGLVALLRISGNRTLSQMNSFDFIITIAMGSTFSSGLLDKNVSLTDTLLALALLIGMQFGVTWLTIRSKKIDSLVKSRPALLYHGGQILREEMRRQRVNEDELFAAIRNAGISTFGQVEAIVLETNGKLSAIPKQISRSEVIEGRKSYEDASQRTH